MHRSTRQSEIQYKGTRRRLRFLMVVVVCFMSWAGLTLWGQTDQVNSKQSELELMEAKLAEVVKQNEAYKFELHRLNDPEYLEQLIRKDLNMTKPDETMFIPIK